MQKTCYIHIGIHKTATTSIQTYLVKNEKALFNSYGLYVVKAGRTDPVSGNHNLAWEVNRDPRFHASYGTFQDMKKELLSKEPTNVIISSEDFSYLARNDESLRQLRDFFNDMGYEVKIIAFLRNQISLANSLYSTLVRCSLEQSFEGYIREIYTSGSFQILVNEQCLWSFSFDHKSFLTTWKKIFKDNIICRSFDKEKQRGRIEERFLECLHISIGEEERKSLVGIKEENPSFSQYETEAVFLFNAILSKSVMPYQKRSDFIDTLHKRVKELQGDIRKFNGFDSPNFRSFVERFSESNEWLREKYGVELILPSEQETLLTENKEPKIHMSPRVMEEFASLLNIFFAPRKE